MREGIGMGAVCIINLLKDTGEESKVSCYNRGGGWGFIGKRKTGLGPVGIRESCFFIGPRFFPIGNSYGMVCKKKIPSLRSL